MRWCHCRTQFLHWMKLRLAFSRTCSQRYLKEELNGKQFADKFWGGQPDELVDAEKFKVICMKIIEEYGLLSVQRPLKDIVADVFVDMPAVNAAEFEWIHRWVENQSKDPLKSGSRKLALVNAFHVKRTDKFGNPKRIENKGCCSSHCTDGTRFTNCQTPEWARLQGV